MVLSRGKYFPAKFYVLESIHEFESVKDFLPAPITDDEELLELYWFTLRLAFKNAKAPENHEEMVANYQDSAFNQNLFLWDSAFISRFLSPFSEFLPGIKTLDNFYHRQLDDGLIPREFDKATGKDYSKWVNPENLPLNSFFHNHYVYRGINDVTASTNRYFPDLGRTPKVKPFYTLDNLNHPILSYAEYNHYLHTKDKARLAVVHEPLHRYYLALRDQIRHQSGLYVTDWASMDNSPRNKRLFIGVDISSEMVLFARMMALIYRELGLSENVKRIEFYDNEVVALSSLINDFLWDDETGFYYDLDQDLKQIRIKTIAGFWPLIAKICDTEQAKKLASKIQDRSCFNRIHPIPSLSADEEGFKSDGGYWSGGVWAPTNLMVTDGLEIYGMHKLAKEIALKHLSAVMKVYLKTGTIWESYPADALTSGDSDKGDYVGWTGIGPILYFLQYHIGLKADATNNKLIWEIDSDREHSGCRNYAFLGKKAGLKACKCVDGYQIEVITTDTFDLEISINERHKLIQISGNAKFHIPVES